MARLRVKKYDQAMISAPTACELIEASGPLVRLSRVIVVTSEDGVFEAECLDMTVVSDGVTVQAALDALASNAAAALNFQRSDRIEFGQAIPQRLAALWSGTTFEGIQVAFRGILFAERAVAEGARGATASDIVLVHALDPEPSA